MTLGTYWPRSRGQSFFRDPPLAGFLRLSRGVSRQESTDPHRHSADRTLSSPSGAPYVARRTCLTRQSARLEAGAALVPLMRVRLPAKRRLRFGSCRNRTADQGRRSIGMRPTGYNPRVPRGFKTDFAPCGVTQLALLRAASHRPQGRGRRVFGRGGSDYGSSRASHRRTTMSRR